MKRNGLKYEDGNVLDPRDGKIYKAKMTHQPRRTVAHDARLCGITLFGKDETWYRLPDTAVASLDPAIVAKYLPAQAAAMKPAVGVVKPAAAAKKNVPVQPLR